MTGLPTQNLHFWVLWEDPGNYETYTGPIETDGSFGVEVDNWTDADLQEGPLGKDCGSLNYFSHYDDTPPFDCELSLEAGRLVENLDFPPLTSPALSACYDVILGPAGELEMYTYGAIHCWDAFGLDAASERVVLGSISVPISDGQITDLGTPTFDAPGVGDLEVGIRWKGALADPGSNSACWCAVNSAVRRSR